MNKVLESALLYLIKQLITEDMVNAFKKQLVEYLKELAQKSENRVDDHIVSVIAEALGVEV